MGEREISTSQQIKYFFYFLREDALTKVGSANPKRHSDKQEQTRAQTHKQQDVSDTSPGKVEKGKISTA